MNKFLSDFERFTDMIKSNNNFSFVRYGDGEVMLMKGNQIGENTQAFSVDKWKSPNRLTKVGLDLLETLNHFEENFFYGIPSSNDNLEDYEFLTKLIKNKKNITFANIWVNANYSRMKKFYESLSKKINLICNHKAKKESFPFTIERLFEFPDNCVEFWENDGEKYLEDLKNSVKNINNQTFFISCGPVAEIIIHKLYICNPNNQYIDVGSSIDEYVHGYQTRPYMNSESVYSRQMSYFE